MTSLALVATFVAPTSGGIRTVLRHLATGYAAHGHRVTVVVPGRRSETHHLPWGTLRTVAAPPVPGTGYRLLTDPAAVVRVLQDVRPDRLEVHDRSTLLPLGHWARRAGVRSLVVAHERLDRLLHRVSPHPRLTHRPALAAADHWNRRLARAFDTVVCTTSWAADDLRRVGVRPHVVPLGVDLDRFTPRTRARTGRPLAVVVSRLSKEKDVALAVDATRALAGSGLELVVAGHGPQATALHRRAAGALVTFTGHLHDRTVVAHLLRSADVLLAPGPVETFGLAALEALACGTPVVARTDTGLAEVLAPGAGLAAPGDPASFAAAVTAVLTGAGDRSAARARAQEFPWSATVEGFLARHDVSPW